MGVTSLELSKEIEKYMKGVDNYFGYVRCSIDGVMDEWILEQEVAPLAERDVIPAYTLCEILKVLPKDGKIRMKFNGWWEDCVLLFTPRELSLFQVKTIGCGLYLLPVLISPKPPASY